MAEPTNPDTTLTTKFLSVRGQEFSDQDALRAAATPRGSEFTETGNDHELRSQAIAANLAPDKDASFVLSASQQIKRDSLTTGSKAKQRNERQQLQMTLADHARGLSERLGRQIAAMETAFEAEMGDAWREQIANKVMDADDIPQRREGETMQAYRERLETALITAMIDDNGDIKPEYANSDDPDIQRYAEWAQAQHRKNELDNTPPEQMQDFLNANADWADIQRAEQTMYERGADSTITAQRTDDLTDSASDVGAESNFFGTSPSG